MSDLLFIFFGFSGLGLFVFRLWPRKTISSCLVNEDPKVSIIVPARNEEKNLPHLLASLKSLTYPRFEVIVVDDQSSDQTSVIAEKYDVKLVRGVPKPSDWGGKQWACQQGSLVAGGDYLLFTDADTYHHSDNLEKALSFMQKHQLDLMSALPFHRGKTIWESLLGPFHLLLLAVTAPYNDPEPGRLFAIGQYLMFKKTAYLKLGGHASVKTKLVEDVPIANLALKKGLKFKVFTNSCLFEVRMYLSLSDFLQGWRRNFRAGFIESRLSAPFEVALMICGLLGSCQFSNPHSWLLIAFSCSFLIWRQSSIGNFSVFGIIFLPFSLFLFTWISLLSSFDLLTKAPLKWKDRSYRSIKGTPD